MSESGRQILKCLEAVEGERAARACSPALAEAVSRVKAWQHERFERTYADLLRSERFGSAARFFLEDLYGPSDFSVRDRQFARVVPGLTRLFSREVVDTVAALAELHALSEAFDSAMARAIGNAPIDVATYLSAWCSVGRPHDRDRQIELMLTVGAALDRYTRSSLLRRTLLMMRTPARAAGLGALQDFLERGFETFRAMGGAAEFLETISSRERRLASQLFAREAGGLD